MIIINFCTLISYVTTILVIYNELYVIKINDYHKALIILNSNLGFLNFRKKKQKEEILQVLSLNDEIHQDINRKFIIAQDLHNQIMNGQEIERPDTRLAPLSSVLHDYFNFD